MTKNRKSIGYASSPKRETMGRQKTTQLNIDCKVKHRLRLWTMPTAQLECEGAEVNLFSLVCIVPEAGDDGKTKVAFSNNRAAKDQHNRQRGLQRLEKQIKAGRLTKSNINNKGYNKYLKMQGKITIEIDYEKFKADKLWDGLKGYITNTQLGAKQVIENYKNLWHIENAFRMSKTDLRIRPIYHRLRHRIEAHVCISFTAYCIYKELERVLYKEKSTLSIKKAAELTHNMYEITFTLPESKHTQSKLLKMDDLQTELYQIVQKKCEGAEVNLFSLVCIVPEAGDDGKTKVLLSSAT